MGLDYSAPSRTLLKFTSLAIKPVEVWTLVRPRVLRRTANSSSEITKECGAISSGTKPCISLEKTSPGFALGRWQGATFFLPNFQKLLQICAIRHFRVPQCPLRGDPNQANIEHHGRPGFLGSRFRFGITRRDSYVSAAAERLAAVVLAVGFDPGSEREGSDRTFRPPPGQDELIAKIAALNKHTIVVITSGGAVHMNSWLKRVPGVLEAWYSGQEGGTALAQVLFGDADPSGRLPVSFEWSWVDNPLHDSYYAAPGSDRVVYSEGVFVGYRRYQRSGVKPLFPFAYGLSYTTFHCDNLSIRHVADSAATVGTSGSDLAYEVSWNVTNTGSRSGSDVSEVYVREVHPTVPRPTEELKGFVRLDLRPGDTQRVNILLNWRAFAYFDATSHTWRADPGDFTIMVGHSADQLDLRGTVSLPR